MKNEKISFFKHCYAARARVRLRGSFLVVVQDQEHNIILSVSAVIISISCITVSRSRVQSCGGKTVLFHTKPRGDIWFNW